MLRRTIVDFSDVLRPWDGFGINYVQTSQTRDPVADPQDYGGFDVLAEVDRRKVIEMVFGDEGLKPGLVKMFLDPFHQNEPPPEEDLDDPLIDQSLYQHTATTNSMRRFAREGLEMTRRRGDDLQIITTLYGPPGWMTKQQVWRGRDLDPRYKLACAKYMVSWAQYLRDADGLPVRYVSLHNEGEDWMRWDEEGITESEGHDYNLYWPPEQVVEFLPLVQEVLEANGLDEVGVAPGECSNWLRFVEWGHAPAIADNPEAVANLGLITSHGFYSPGFHRWAGDYRSTGIDMLRRRRPELHAWVTSTSWSDMDVGFLAELRDSVYVGKINGLIPWACIQRHDLWKGGDPNPGTAFLVTDEGELKVQPGYWWYKQLCRTGQPGTGVARVVSNDTQVMLAAFADNGSGHGDAAVALNTSGEPKAVELELRGTKAAAFEAFRTGGEDRFASQGEMPLQDGSISCTLPPRSATSFFAL
ncbi:MAG: hypothetical protein R6V05_07150 [Candidatus Brocadiia bacterium]